MNSAINNSKSLERLIVVLRPFRSEYPSDVLSMSCRHKYGQFQNQHAFWGGCGSHSNRRDEQLLLIALMKTTGEPSPLAVINYYFSPDHTIF